jgi:hypothetical protein
MAVSAHGYRPVEFRALIALAVLSVVLVALAARRGILPNLTAYLKAAGAVAPSLLAGGALQLWYTSIYLPANTDVGLDLSAVVGARLRVSRSLTLVPIQVMLRNDSSLTAVVLTSMFTVTGVHYLPTSPSVGVTSTDARTIGLGDPVPLPRPHPLLAIGRLLRDGARLFPNANKSLSIIVPVPRTGF